jgi:hypothetical protein
VTSATSPDSPRASLQYGCALEQLRRALLCDAQGRASTPLDATTAESAMR